MELSSTKKYSKYISYCCMLCTSFFWVTGYLYCSQNNINPIQLSIVRGIILTALCYAICKFNNKKIQIRALMNKKMILRNILFIVHGFTIAMSQFYLPLFTVHTLSNFGIVAVISFDYLIDGKAIPKSKIFWLLLALVGILIIGNRSWILSQFDEGVSDGQIETSFENYRTSSPLIQSIVALMVLVAMSLEAYGIKITEKSNIPQQQTNLSFGIMLTIISSILYFYVPVKTSPEILYPSYLWTGIPLGLAQIFFVMAIMTAVQVGITMSLMNSGIIIAYLISIFRYSQPLSVICFISSAVSIISLTKVLID